MGLSGSSSSVAKQSSLGSGRGLTYLRACVKSKFYGAFVLNFEHPTHSFLRVLKGRRSAVFDLAGPR